MPTPTEDRNTAICARYIKDGDTAECLALDYGLSVMMIRVILKAGNALRGDRRRLPKTQAEKVLSPMHSRIGALLSHHRAFTLGIDRRMASEELGWSMQRVASVEKGGYNITLIDLQDIARFLKIQLEELLSGPTRNQGQVVLEHDASPGAYPALVYTHPEGGADTEPEDILCKEKETQ